MSHNEDNHGGQKPEYSDGHDRSEALCGVNKPEASVGSDQSHKEQSLIEADVKPFPTHESSSSSVATHITAGFKETVPLASLLLNIPEVKRAQVHPEHPYEFAHTLKGRRNKWFKPLLSLVLMVLFYIISASVLSIPYVMYLFSTGKITPEQFSPEVLSDLSNLGNFVYIMTSIIIFIPCVFLVNYLVYGQRPGTLSSVAGHLRKGLLFRCLLLGMLVVGIFNVALPLLSGSTISIKNSSEIVLALVLIVLLVPFQATAEEYVFRGWFTQVIGSCSQSPRYGYVMAGVVSIPFFTGLHGATDPLVITYLASFATIALYLVYKTGGLEASIGLHITNNIFSLVISYLSGAADTALANTTTIALPELIAGDIMLVVYAIGALLIYKRMHENGAVDTYAYPKMAQLDINPHARRPLTLVDTKS